MSRLVLTSALALGALAVIGGFTPGAATAHAAPDVSPFVGSWSGTWTVAAGEVGEHSGSFDWTISEQGQITGAVHGSSNSGTVAGHVGADGNILMVGYAPNDVPSTAQNGYPFHGTAVIDVNGKLVASMTGAEASGGNLLVAVLERN
jgi:hypothetical protein